MSDRLGMEGVSVSDSLGMGGGGSVSDSLGIGGGVCE